LDEDPQRGLHRRRGAVDREALRETLSRLGASPRRIAQVAVDLRRVIGARGDDFPVLPRARYPAARRLRARSHDRRRGGDRDYGSARLHGISTVAC